MLFDTTWLGTAGRTLIVLSFVVAGLYNIAGRTNHIARLKAFNVPFPPLAFWFGMTVQFIGCLLIVTQWRPDLGALCLIAFTVAATLIYHRFWTKEDPAQRTVSRITMVGNVAIIGGLLMIWQG